MKSTFIEKFINHSSQFPDRVIVKDYQKNWTWGDLVSRASDYCAIIQKNSSQKIIPIFVDRTGETVAAILGCILSGKGFAPISPNQPRERIEKCLGALGADVLIVVDDSDELLEKFENVSCLRPQVGFGCFEKLQILPIEDEAIIYNLFTSGSTGVPKGVMVSASNIENTMLWSKDFLNWNPSDVIGSATNFFFDISMFDFFSMVYFNVPIAIFSQTTNPEIVISEIQKFEVTSIFSVPLFFSQLSRMGLSSNLNRLVSLRRIVAGGDFFPPAHMLNWIFELPAVEVFNVWGPTETSIVNTMHRVTSSDIPLLQDGRSTSVGRAHKLMPFILVDESRTTVIDKPNERGEIVMLGPCVTMGYLNAPELSSLHYGNFKNLPAFYTQDLGYVDESGNLFILGRMGSTVKISGYRVDLGEIESIATQFTNVYVAVAFVKKISEEVEELWLAVEVVDKLKQLEIFEFKNFLRKKLPNYMVPKKIIIQDTLPKNQNGKIDRNQIKKKFFNE